MTRVGNRHGRCCARPPHRTRYLLMTDAADIIIVGLALSLAVARLLVAVLECFVNIWEWHSESR